MAENIRHINKIYNSNKIIRDNINSKIKKNREYLISRDIADELNTYRTWEVFPTFNDIYIPEYEGDNENYSVKLQNTPGVRSIFNKYGAVMLGGNYDVTKESSNWRYSNNVPLMDSPNTRKTSRNFSQCTIKDLIKSSENGEMGQEIYSYSDFMYCKYLGRVSNSYLITLRRFPIPVDDHISATGISDRSNFSSQNPSSIGCLVTWLGTPGNELNNILKYDFSMPFKEQTAEFQDVDAGHDKGKGMLNKVAAVFDKSYRENVMAGSQNNPFANYANSMLPKWAGTGDAPYDAQSLATWRDKNKVYGPVDAVKKTYMRGEDGIQFGQSFTLTFDYELRSYDGINPRQALLDLISNILNVTYTTGTFWGGGYRGIGQAQNSIFNNMKIFQTRGGFTEMMDALLEDAQNATESFKSKYVGPDGNLNFSSIKQALKSMLNQIGGMLLGGWLNKLGRPQKVMLNSLLSPAPVGFWHVTIGNPKHPIMSLGNMILKKTTIEHYGPLGIDEFPIGLKVTCELERGKPRDLREIEKIYMNGNDRIFHSMTGKVADMYKYAKEYKGSKYYDNNKGSADTDANSNSLQNNNRGLELNDVLKKYFGTSDSDSIIFAASEQEWGSQKKKSGN